VKWTFPVLVVVAGLGVATLAAGGGADGVVFASAPGVPGRVAFTASDGDIWTVGAAGSGWRRLTDDGASNLAPAWSHDGEQLAYVAADSRVYRIKHDGSARAVVARGEFGTISWSPDGSALALTESDRATRGRTTIAIVNAGTKPRRIVRWPTPPERHSPAWSPDGGLIAYTQDGYIYLVRPDRTGVRRLARGDHAEWTADGESVAVSYRGVIRLYPRNGGVGRLLVRDRGARDFALDPTGKRIAVSDTVPRGNSDPSHIFIIDVAKGTRRDVTGDRLEGDEPDWQSRCTIYGTERADVIRGTPGPDVICARGGSDWILARGGNDVIYGGAGSDEIDGGAGNDWLFGSFGDDNLHARLGGRDIVDGGPGNDRAQADEDLDTSRSVELQGH
jgi:Ca2+-binding RTX toxin-like protein